MQRSNELDGIDFRPFFDMAVGILFVLLILIGALMVFQRTEDGGTAASAQSNSKRWRLQRDRFLERLAAELGAAGLTAKADTAASTVSIGLDEVARLSGPNLPSLEPAPVEKLGAVLSAAVRCLSIPRTPQSDCADTELLSLGGLSIQVRMGMAAPGQALPRDRLARFLGGTLSNALYTNEPSLLRASNRAGAPAVAFEDGTIGDGRDGSRGDLALVFGFDNPAP